MQYLLLPLIRIPPSSLHQSSYPFLTTALSPSTSPYYNFWQNFRPHVSRNRRRGWGGRREDFVRGGGERSFDYFYGVTSSGLYYPLLVVPFAILYKPPFFPHSTLSLHPHAPLRSKLTPTEKQNTQTPRLHTLPPSAPCVHRPLPFVGDPPGLDHGRWHLLRLSERSVAWNKRRLLGLYKETARRARSGGGKGALKAKEARIYQGTTPRPSSPLKLIGFTISINNCTLRNVFRAYDPRRWMAEDFLRIPLIISTIFPFLDESNCLTLPTS